MQELKKVNGWYVDLDPEGEMAGVVLDHPVICGKCILPMREIGKGRYKCTDCGQTFERE